MAVEDVVEELRRLAEIQEQQVQPGVRVVMESGELLEGIRGNPLVTKVEQAIAELFASLRGAHEEAVAAAAEVKDLTHDAQAAYNEVVGNKPFEEAGYHLERNGRYAATEVMLNDSAIKIGESSLLESLRGTVTHLERRGRMTADAAVAVGNQSQTLIEMSAMYAAQISGQGGGTSVEYHGG